MSGLDIGIQAESYLSTLRRKGRKESTIICYRNGLRQCFACLMRDHRSTLAEDISTDDVHYLWENLTVKEEVRQGYLRNLAGFVQFYTGRDVVKQADILRNREVRNRVFIDRQDYAVLIHNATPFQRIILVLGGMMGLRRVEMLALTDEDVCSGHLVIHGKGHGNEGLVINAYMPATVREEIERYRKDREEIVQLAGSLKDAGINLADLTMGEDPRMYADDYKLLLELVSAVHDEVGINIMASPGALPREMFPRLREAGADWHACYQETYNRELFSKLRLDQDFDARKNQKIWAMEAGLLAEDGMMIGLGETVRDRAETILEMGSTGCQQIRAMTFVPQEGTPMQMLTPFDSTEELKAIAVMRILYPDRLIPATLDVEGIAGLKTRINAGANVITSIVPPNRNLAGVAQHELDIENGNRSVEHVFSMLDEMGYRRATSAEYQAFLDEHRPRGGA